MIKTKKTKKSSDENSLNDNDTNKDIKIDIQNDVDLTESEKNEGQEKTGWWS